MSYVRPAKKNEIVKWLLDNGYAEEKPGYGHVDAEELADALMKEWDLVGFYNTAI